MSKTSFILLLVAVASVGCSVSTMESSYAYLLEKNKTLDNFMMESFRMRMPMMDNYSVSFSMMGKEMDLFISFQMMSDNRIAVVSQNMANMAEMEMMMCNHNMTMITMCSMPDNMDKMMYMIMMSSLAEYMPKMQMKIEKSYSKETPRMMHEETYNLVIHRDMESNYNMVESKGKIMQEGMSMSSMTMMPKMDSTSNIKINMDMRTMMEPMSGIMQSSLMIFKTIHLNTEIMARIIMKNLNRYPIESIAMKSNMEMINKMMQKMTTKVMTPMSQLTDLIMSVMMEMRTVKTIIFSKMIEGMHMELNYEINMINNMIEINFMLDSQRIDFLSKKISFPRQKMNLFMMQKLEKLLTEELFTMMESQIMQMIPSSMKKMEETLITPFLNNIMNKMESEMMNLNMKMSGIISQIKTDITKFGNDFMKMREKCQIMNTFNMTMMKMGMMKENIINQMESYMMCLDNMKEHMMYLMKFGKMENSSSIIRYLMQMMENRSYFSDLFTYFRNQMMSKINTTMAHMTKNEQMLMEQMSELMSKMLMSKKNEEMENIMPSNSIFMNGEIERMMDINMKGGMKGEILLEWVKRMVEKMIEMRDDMEEVERRVERMMGRIRMMMFGN
jgi:hypothetical protein